MVPTSLATPTLATLGRASIVAIALLAGCSRYTLAEPNPPPVPLFDVPPRTGVALVCVIHPSHMAIAVTFAVRDNGQLVGATRAESYFCYEAEPGEHRIVSSTEDPVDSDGDARLDAVAGRRYWAHQDFDNVMGMVTSRLEWVDETRAHELMEDVRADYKQIVGVPGNETLPARVPRVRALQK
jgi:hypothetical protein